MKYVFRIALAVAVIVACWQILVPEVTNMIFQDEVHDSAAQMGYRTGVAPLNSDEEIRNLVIRKAAKHDIELDPKQVTVQRNGVGEYTTWYVAVDYTAKVDLLVYSFKLHFNPTSKGGMFGGIGISEPASHFESRARRSETEPANNRTAGGHAAETRIEENPGESQAPAIASET
jgi:hypothetical protein